MFMATRLLEEKVDRELAELREFLEMRRVPKKVRNKVRRYMEHLYRRKTGYDEQELLERLPPALSKELLDHLYRSQLQAVAIFNGLPVRACALLNCVTARPHAPCCCMVARQISICWRFPPSVTLFLSLCDAMLPTVTHRRR